MSNLDLMLDVGLANELKLAFRKAGFTSAEIKALTEENILREILDVMHGFAEITYPEHIIDPDVDPFIPDGWTVEEHKKMGQWKFNPAEISFFLSNKQKKGSIVGHDLRKELAKRAVLNANVLDYLLAHPELIPDKWKGKYIFFWGTIYRDSVGRLYARCLRWGGGRWDWDYRWLGRDFYDNNPAMILASI